MRDAGINDTKTLVMVVVVVMLAVVVMVAVVVIVVVVVRVVIVVLKNSSKNNIDTILTDNYTDKHSKIPIWCPLKFIPVIEIIITSPRLPNHSL